MSAYISESFRFFEIAENKLHNYSDNKDAFICVLFSALYLEGVINDIIFHDQLLDKQYKQYYAKKNAAKNFINRLFEFLKQLFSNSQDYDFDLYNERISFESKTNLIFTKYNIKNYGIIP